MHKNIVLVAETGSDITPELAAKLGLKLVPMHVTIGDETLDDGTFPPEDVCAYYDKTGAVPKTAGSNPADFEVVFDEIHEQYPDKSILYLAYSAITTVSYASAQIAGEGKDYIRSVDTKHVSVGQGVVCREVAKYLDQHPDCTLDEAAAFAEEIKEKVQMSFIPRNLDYLRAGGRVSNSVALIGNLLSLHPCIEIIDGQLLAKKKYRGQLMRCIPKLIKDFTEKYNIHKDHLYLIWSPYLEDECKKIAEETAISLGYTSFSWVKTGCVITTHGGPGAFGIVGLTD